MKKILLLALLGSMLFPGVAHADEGMWLPNLIGSRIHDMREKGFKLTAEDIYSVNQASLKDAIVMFGRGCTGELVSDEGLLFTNHHCGFGQIQAHSSVEHDYLADGFWAMNRGEELPNPGLTVTFLVRMEDVTDRVNAGVDEQAPEADRNAARAANIAAVIKDATEGTHYRAAVEPFYYGNQYFLFVNEVFEDVRLVGAPPSSIGSFGGDTDNWMWPRHTGDFSIFRIYAGKDNMPAAYSPDNVPYRPKKSFAISTRGVEPGDFTMIYGFPGSTQQFIISDAVDYVLNQTNPMRIKLRTMRLDVIREARAADQAVRIAYAAKQSGIANAWKKWQGESLGLERLGTIDKKRHYETIFQRWADQRPEYAGVLPELKRHYAEMRPYSLAADYYSEAILAVELTRAARLLEAAMQKEETAGMPEDMQLFYKDYYPAIDRRISAMLLAEYVREMPAEFIPGAIADRISALGGTDGYVAYLFENSALADAAAMEAAFADPQRLAAIAANDPAVEFYREFRDMFNEDVRGTLVEHSREISRLYKTYVAGMMQQESDSDRPSGRAFFPDANLTLRVAYGHVEGYEPDDAVVCLPRSTVRGIMEKDNPEIYDYNIPQRLRDIVATKDYGRWEVDGTIPVCFLATNHTTGGNSGSPVLNGDGEMIGINFDRTWLSTMSDIEFDPTMCRNISVDIRYVLFTIDRIGGASYLFDEMTLK